MHVLREARHEAIVGTQRRIALAGLFVAQRLIEARQAFELGAAALGALVRFPALEGANDDR
jgi:hypothetical protein